MQNEEFWLNVSSNPEFKKGRKVHVAEAAIVYAGHEYREVFTADDCPDAFSRPITNFAIRITGDAHPRLREEFLTRLIPILSVTADTADVEKRRGEFIAVEACRRIILVFIGEVLSRPCLAGAYRHIDAQEGLDLCCRLLWEVKTARHRCVLSSAGKACLHGLEGFSDMAAHQAGRAIYASYLHDPLKKYTYLKEAGKILEEAILLGNHGQHLLT
jgi:hypothetical protein